MNSNNASYPGISRLAYLGCFLILLAGGALIGLTNPRHYWQSPPLALLLLAGTPLTFAITALRLQNIGESAWLAAVLAVPFLSLLVMLYCLIAPTGYRQHRQMDWIGGAFIAAFAAFITTVIALAIFG